MSTYSTVGTQLRRRYNYSLQFRINLIAKILLFELQLLRNVEVELEFTGIFLGLNVVYIQSTSQCHNVKVMSVLCVRKGFIKAPLCDLIST